jgi:hypothetical protein
MKTDKKEATAKPEAKEKPVLTHTAIGTYKDDKGYWQIVEIPFDPKSHEVGDLVTKDTLAMDRASAQESFKLRVVDAIDAFHG